jgi:hypothetical protein
MKQSFYIFITAITLPVMSTLLNESALTLLIATVAAISGWATVVYEYFSDKPKIKGKILQVMRGTFQNPEKPSDSLTVFVLFLYLTNARKNNLHLSDYILEIDIGGRFERMKMIRGITDQSIHFGYEKGGEVQIPDFNKGLIYKQTKAVEFGTPFYGYLAFAGDVKYHKADIQRYRITCVDVFDHKHKITTESKKFVDLFYLQEVFGIQIPKT